MATASVPNTFVNGTTADADQVNADFSALVSFLNNQVLHRDGSKALTGDLDAASHRIINLPTPNSNSQPATKQYVDSAISSVVSSAASFEVSTATEVGQVTLNQSTFGVVASVNLSIPGSWSTWRVEAFATYVVREFGASGDLDVQARLVFSGNAKQTKQWRVPEGEHTDGAIGASHSTPNATTVALEAWAAVGGGIIQDIYLYARAIRTG